MRCFLILLLCSVFLTGTVLAQQSSKSDEQSELGALRKTVGGSLYSTGGGGGQGDSSLLRVYGSIVEQAIKKNWRYPVFANHPDLSTLVEVRIDAKGQITEVETITSSGQKDYDAAAIKAVRETKELPPPPSEAIRIMRIQFTIQELNR